MDVRCNIETWPFERPFRFSGHVWTESEVIVVEISDGEHTGRGEASGVYYKQETPQGMAREVEAFVRDRSAFTRDDLLAGLPSGGARNALDCALWDLEARRADVPVWRLAGQSAPKPLLTTYTLGADAADAMVANAEQHPAARCFKLKLVGDGLDAERVAAVRRGRPDAWIGVDGNQAFTPNTLMALAPALLNADVQLLEQPFPVGSEAWMGECRTGIPTAADESAVDLEDLGRLREHFDMINLKLDKSGGLTRALQMAAEARRLGFGLMVGNMGGTSLAMAPAFVLAQICDLADLDGPTVLDKDRVPGVTYIDGRIDCGDAVWGSRLAAHRT